ncbi:tRNA dihydrouridine(20/20a) synthase DusA [Cucumibacter marinus]|uniref:tRNA dihydrouridine(20/20a) synthase DusA n=1 Tax=Cucumibacter marinus TaxID=1121252 RepID=UPI00048E2F90|nr:tRNA dihydrouridine(20/20a) synthase DusA [Cucumibacter marinus]
MPLSDARRFSIAPMMDWTDRHCRFFHRILTRRSLLFTEMITSAALIRGGADWLLRYNPEEHPVAIQLGGSDPEELAAAAKLSADFGYDEINLNIGCPSDRVQSGRFGACLMAEPALVAECVAAMKQAVDIPVTVKCRIGIDDQDSEADLNRFADAMVGAGTDVLYVHARKAWLQGLSPAQNRDVPPLDYERVYRLRERLSPLPVMINGGIEDLDAAEAHLGHVDGVMLGRAAYHNPSLLLDVDRRFFGDRVEQPSLEEIARQMVAYAGREMEKGVKLNQIARHMIGIGHGLPGARRYRQIMTMEAVKPDATPQLIEDALSIIAPHWQDRVGEAA